MKGSESEQFATPRKEGTGVGLQPLNSIGFLFLLCELDNEVRSINIDYRFGISVYLILIDIDAKRNASTLLSASLSISMKWTEMSKRKSL